METMRGKWKKEKEEGREEKGWGKEGGKKLRRKE